MPHNKGQKINNLQNDSSLREESVTLRSAKFAKRPPSLNKINKQLP